MERNTKISSLELKKQGWQDTNQTFGDCSIFIRGNETILYHEENEEICFHTCPTPKNIVKT